MRDKIGMNYDIFISYKSSDEIGNKTRDYFIAQKLYERLTEIGYSVFFSSQTLEEIGSSRYKADIDNALDTAEIMVVVLTDPNYASAHWVKYEWDSFYNEYLSGVKDKAALFTLTENVNIHDLPRTLRNVQNFDSESGFDRLCEFIRNSLPKRNNIAQEDLVGEIKKNEFSILTGKQISIKDIEQAIELDFLVYDDIYHISKEQCLEWFIVNPDIYVMARDNKLNKIIAYVNISPVTSECYERIKNGDFIDTEITADMLLSYDMPYPYNLYIFSIVIHPDYQNTSVFFELFNAVVKKFLYLGEQEVFIKRLMADAVTKNGEKFCKMFGMTKIKGSNHNSTLYEVSLIPPKFRVLSKMTKLLFEYYAKKYEESPWLFPEE